MTPSRGPFLHITISPELLARLDDFRYINRFPTQAEAVRWLLEAALAADLKPDAAERRP